MCPMIHISQTHKLKEVNKTVYLSVYEASDVHFPSSYSIKTTDKNHQFEALLPFSVWGTGNVSSSLPTSPYFILLF
jgi:hypothetical protein